MNREELHEIPENERQTLIRRAEMLGVYAIDWPFGWVPPEAIGDLPYSIDLRKFLVCPKCPDRPTLIQGQALISTLVPGEPDFPGDPMGVTLSAGGPGKLVGCWKCPECGYSVK